MKPRVFLSHKSEDSLISIAVAERLRARGLEVYLDVIDNALKLGGEDLADYIRAQLDRCTQLLAIISTATQSSWWVPWEIGVATEKERFLASFVAQGANVPDYLRKWPFLRSDRDLDVYAAQSIQAREKIEGMTRGGTRTAATAVSPRVFHRSLKAALGQ